MSVCSGIEAASVAWQPLSWEAVGFSEIDPFAAAVLQYRLSDGSKSEYKNLKKRKLHADTYSDKEMV